jgi:hypothetical protein
MMSAPYTDTHGTPAPQEIQAKCEDLGRKSSVIWVRQNQVEADCMYQHGYLVR